MTVFSSSVLPPFPEAMAPEPSRVAGRFRNEVEVEGRDVGVTGPFVGLIMGWFVGVVSTVSLAVNET